MTDTPGLPHRNKDKEDKGKHIDADNRMKEQQKRMRAKNADAQTTHT